MRDPSLHRFPFPSSGIHLLDKAYFLHQALQRCLRKFTQLLGIAQSLFELSGLNQNHRLLLSKAVSAAGGAAGTESSWAGTQGPRAQPTLRSLLLRGTVSYSCRWNTFKPFSLPPQMS